MWAREVAQQWKIPHWTADLAESLAQPGLDAVILTTPTQIHAAQGEQCMRGVRGASDIVLILASGQLGT